jgi:hypothetical protein
MEKKNKNKKEEKEKKRKEEKQEKYEEGWIKWRSSEVQGRVPNC